MSKTREELYVVLDHFSDALSIVTTATRALEAAENDVGCATVGPEIRTFGTIQPERGEGERVRAVYEMRPAALVMGAASTGRGDRI